MDTTAIAAGATVVSAEVAADRVTSKWLHRLKERLLGRVDLTLSLARRHDHLWQFLRHGLDERGLPDEVRAFRRANLLHLTRGVQNLAIAAELKIPTFFGSLGFVKFRGLGRRFPELALELARGFTTIDEYDARHLGLERLAYGTASLRVVTTAGVNAIRDAFLNTTELETFDFHALGTGSTAEAIGDTALVTELGSGSYTGGVRATGTPSSNGNGVYRSVGTNTKADAGTASVVEHMLTSQAALAGGICFDRSVFASVSLAQADSLQTTYDHTQTGGS